MDLKARIEEMSPDLKKTIFVHFLILLKGEIHSCNVTVWLYANKKFEFVTLLCLILFHISLEKTSLYKQAVPILLPVAQIGMTGRKLPFSIFHEKLLDDGPSLITLP